MELLDVSFECKSAHSQSNGGGEGTKADRPDRPVLLASGSHETTVDDADKRLYLDHTEQTITISAQIVLGSSIYITQYNPLGLYQQSASGLVHDADHSERSP